MSYLCCLYISNAVLFFLFSRIAFHYNKYGTEERWTKPGYKWEIAGSDNKSWVIHPLRLGTLYFIELHVCSMCLHFFFGLIALVKIHGRCYKFPY
jgi:hypothetical protein